MPPVKGRVEAVKYTEPSYIGIDPGGSGGIAIIRTSRGGSVEAVPTPECEVELWNLIRGWVQSETVYSCKDGFECEVYGVVEKVGGFIPGERGGSGMTGQPGSAMFKFGQSYGTLRMAAIGNGVDLSEVTPQAWQKALSIPPRRRHTGTAPHVVTKGKNRGKTIQKKVGGESDTEFKNRLKARAQELFPGVKVTLATADALLLAEYCLRKHMGVL